MKIGFVPSTNPPKHKIYLLKQSMRILILENILLYSMYMEMQELVKSNSLIQASTIAAHYWYIYCILKLLMTASDSLYIQCNAFVENTL